MDESKCYPYLDHVKVEEVNRCIEIADFRLQLHGFVLIEDIFLFNLSEMTPGKTICSYARFHSIRKSDWLTTPKLWDKKKGEREKEREEKIIISLMWL